MATTTQTKPSTFQQSSVSNEHLANPQVMPQSTRANRRLLAQQFQSNLFQIKDADKDADSKLQSTIEKVITSIEALQIFEQQPDSTHQIETTLEAAKKI